MGLMGGLVVMTDDGRCIYCNASCKLDLILNTYYEVMQTKPAILQLVWRTSLFIA